MSATDATDWWQALPDTLMAALGPVKGELAVHYWRANYAHKPSTAAIPFIRDLAAECDLSSAERHAVRTAIHHARSGLSQAQNKDDAKLLAGRVVGRHLLLLMRREIFAEPEVGQREFIAVLTRQMTPENGLHEMAAPALGWLVQGGKMPELGLPSLSLLVHACYVTACKVLGPVRGDEILNMAAASAGKLPEARRLPPAALIYPEHPAMA